MRTIFRLSRYLVVIAVIGLLLAAAAVFVFGLVATVSTILHVFQHEPFNAEGARVLSVEMIEMIDLFLLGTILLITAVGLQELFIEPSLREVLPAWMSVDNLEQLKFNLLAVIVVMLAVLFLGVAASVEPVEGFNILHYGAGIAAVMLASGISVYLFAKVHHMREEHGAEHAPVAVESEHPEH